MCSSERIFWNARENSQKFHGCFRNAFRLSRMRFRFLSPAHKQRGGYDKNNPTKQAALAVSTELILNPCFAFYSWLNYPFTSLSTSPASGMVLPSQVALLSQGNVSELANVATASDGNTVFLLLVNSSLALPVRPVHSELGTSLQGDSFLSLAPFFIREIVRKNCPT